MNLIGLASLVCSAMLVACGGEGQKLTVKNPTGHSRSEVVSVSASKISGGVKDLVIKDAAGKEVPYQVTADGKTLLFAAQVDANATAQYSIEKGSPAEVATVATGKVYPNRVDDIAWENDRVAFRAYGPALQASGEKAYGYDVWVKCVPEPVVDARYASELNPETLKAIAELKKTNPDSAAALSRATSYHYDHGNGLDCYKVGPTLGGGASALLLDGKIVYPYCYKEIEIKENGPLRFEAVLTYNPVQVGGVDVVEVRTLTLDAHSQLNHTVVEYKNLPGETTVVAGPVVHHPDGGENVADKELGFVGYADPTDRPADGYGTIYVGAVFKNALTDAKLDLFDEAEAKERGADGHVLGYTTIKPGEKLDYYWGGGWSKYGFDSFEQWQSYLKDFAEDVKKPLEVSVD